jgi:hypothetical protein
MKIGLIDVDGHNFPNLALMKISAYHKKIGDNVELYRCDIFYNEEYDLVYMSKVFDNTYSKDFIGVVNAKKVIRGGYGYDNYEKPFEEYETTFPDYSIYYEKYPQFKKTAFGYLTRGCPRNCDFCMVGKYEGTKNIQVSELSNFYNPELHNEIKLLDPNLFANKNNLHLLQQLADTKTTIDITQGFDIRLLTKVQCDIINNFKVKSIHFAWDNMDGITEEILEKKRSWLNFGRRKLINQMPIEKQLDYNGG